MDLKYDVIVVGAGHAGCEAAMAAAKLGAKVLLVTSDMNRVAQLSCNPAIGGIAKGQIVREIDALGGQMGIVTDLCSIQFRILNRSKGPAVWSPRAQVDRTRYIDTWRKILDSQDNLYLYQDSVRSLIIEQDGDGSKVCGVVTDMGLEFHAKTVVLTNGTFLNGKLHFGEYKTPGGRISENAIFGLTEQLVSLGFESDRMKTGTPARVDGRSIDYSLVEAQSGDDRVIEIKKEPLSSDVPYIYKECDAKIERDSHKFSFLPEVERLLPPRDCYIVHTNPEVHSLLQENLDRSPLYNGDIQSIGPRYCPSIETKIVTFADKESHQLFLEPEGETTCEFYINGFSSSMPAEIQFEALRRIPALKNLRFYRPGYAIEYDFFNPTQLRHTLETKPVQNLYFAGQINGTTGYEEAAGQGLIAGINAALRVTGSEEFVLKRDESYIGVLIDDLVTKGVDEPYRMFTSRAEYRILLRQDDADMRLTEKSYAIGLASRRRLDLMKEKAEMRDELIAWCDKKLIKATDEINEFLESAGTTKISASHKISDLIRRPQLSISLLESIWPPLADRLRRIPEERRGEVVEAAEILIKYEGYIKREKEMASKMHRLEDVRIPHTFDFNSISALSTEARQKLTKHRPDTIGIASRIPGVSPADISVLLLLLGR